MASGTVTLTVEKLSLYGQVSISAVEDGAGHQAIAMPEEKQYFVRDCDRTWNEASFSAGVPFTASMPADTWGRWLDMYGDF